MEVQILSKKLIKPSIISIPNHPKHMKVSFIDQHAPPVYMPFIFYYPANDNNNNKPQNIVTINLLQKSLSEILTLYYPLAGRYDSENALVNCNDEGVEFIEAKVDGQLSRILNGEFETDLLNKFLPNGYAESATSPLLATQINMFNCGGLAIGICMSHRIADGFAFSTFINAWAKSCRLGLNEVSSPSFELGIFFPAVRDLPNIEAAAAPLKSGLKIVTKRFLFDGKAITKLKAEVDDRQVTRVQMVIALIWKAHISALRAKRGHLRDFLLMLPMNLRGKTVPRVSENCYGNLYKFTNPRFNADESKMELHNFVDLIGNAFRNPSLDSAKTDEFGDDDFFSAVIDSYKEYCEELNKDEADVCTYTSCCRFPIYVDFGWGKPAWVSGIRMSFETVILLDNKKGNAIEAWVSLEEENMFHFLQDPYISRNCT